MRVEHLGIADAPGEFVTRAVEVLQLTFAGVVGDRHFGLTMEAGVRQKHVPKGATLRNSRQLSLVSLEELADIARALGLPKLDYRWLGANVCVSDVDDFTALPASTRLVFESGAVVVVDSENEPCTKAGRAIVAGSSGAASLAQDFVKAARRRRGVVGWVEREGPVRVGDRVTVEKRQS
ncbi:MAG: MOSC domain-containing protein [Myxococcota bacterium]